MITPELTKIICWKPDQMLVQIKLFGRYLCQAVYIRSTNEVFVIGESFAQNFNRSFFDLLQDDLWLDVMLITRVEKHAKYGWIFYLLKN